MKGPAAAILALLTGLVAAPAVAATAGWQPEGLLLGGYALTLEGTRSAGEDAQLEAPVVRLGARYGIDWGLSAEVLGELAPASGSVTRRIPALRHAFAAWESPGFGTFRAGQVPSPWTGTEELLVQDLAIGTGLGEATGLVRPGGLGLGWEADGSAGDWRAGLALAGMWQEGTIGGVVRGPWTLGDTPSLALRGDLGLGPVAAHGYARANAADLSDMVAGGGLSADPDFGHLFLETLALRGASVEQSALVAQAGARIDLASLLPALRQVGLIGRLGWQDLRYAQGNATTSSQSLSWLAGFVFRPTARASLAIGYEAEPTLGGNKGKDLAEAFLRFGVAFP